MHSLLLPSLFIAFIWSIGGIFQKYAMNHINPVTFIAFTTLIYVICVIVYCVFNKKTIIADFKNNTSISVLGAMLAFTLLSMFWSMILLLQLYEKHDAHKVSTLTFVSPVFTLILATLLLKERPTPKSILGVLLVVLGIAFVGH
jgi:drug/metabolite transporter (DMT)-like permease